MAGKAKRRKKPASNRGTVAGSTSIIPKIVDALPATAQACVELGLQLEVRREFPRAKRAFARAVKLAPRSVAAHAHHAYALGRTLDLSGAEAAHKQALRLAPGSAEVMARHGQMFMDNDMHEQAEPVLKRAVELDPNLGDAHMNLCWTLRRLGRLSEAIHHGEIACRLINDSNASFYLAFALLSADRAEDALSVCQRQLTMDPHDIPAMTLMVTALDRCGRRDEGRYLADLEKLVVSTALNPPQGYESLEAFNAELAQAILAAPSRPLDQTQTLDIFEQPQGAMMALWRTFNEASQFYFNSVPSDPDHPFLAAHPQRWVLDGWGNRVRGNPEQEHHFHHHGWLSGVYYVEVPDFVGQDENNLGGCIEFCRFNAYSQAQVESEFMVIKPEPGTLVLFPSFMYHRVLAFSGNAQRISIAFNLTPTAW